MEANSASVLGTYQGPMRRLKYAGSASDVLTAGEFVCFNHDASTANDQEYVVETPAGANIRYPAGIIAKDAVADANGVAHIDIIPWSRVMSLPGIEVFTDQSIAAGDLLGPQPGTRKLRKGLLYGYAVLRASQTVDRSSTAGTVRGTLRPEVGEIERLRFQSEIYDDFMNYVTVHEGLTSSLGTGCTATAAASVLTIAVDGNADNDQAIVASTAALVVPAVGKPFYLEAYATVTDAATANGDYFIGLHDGTISATIPIADDDSLTSTNESFAIFTALAGAKSFWKFQTNDDGATQNSTTTTAPAFATATAYRFGILWDGVSSYLAFINDTLVATHTADLPTGKSLKFVCGVKDSAGAVEQIALDYYSLIHVK